MEPAESNFGIAINIDRKVDEFHGGLRSQVAESGVELANAMSSLWAAARVIQRIRAGSTNRIEAESIARILLHDDTAIRGVAFDCLELMQGLSVQPGSAGEGRISTHEAISVLPARNIFRQKKGDDYWEISFIGGETLRLKHCRGFQYIAELLRNSHNRISASVLASQFSRCAEGKQKTEFSKRSNEQLGEIGMRTSGKADASTQEMTKAELCKQRREVEEALDKARREGDPHEIQFCLSEMADLIRKAKQCTDVVRKPSMQEEKTRKAVGNAIREAYAVIKLKNYGLYQHLFNSIHTGHTCSYQPKTRTDWVLDDATH